MTTYEEALQDAFDRGLHVIENVPLKSDAAAIIYDDVILLSRMATYQQHVCVLAEEIAHHITNVGNILDQTDVANRKQERRARLLAFDRLIGLRGLIQCFLAGDRNRYEVAERLEVTEEFLAEALEMYRGKYGCGKQVDNFWVSFEPYLSIVKIN